MTEEKIEVGEDRPSETEVYGEIVREKIEDWGEMEEKNRTQWKGWAGREVMKIDEGERPNF